MVERQREFVPGRGTKDGERARANGRKFRSWILRLKVKVSDIERRVCDGE